MNTADKFCRVSGAIADPKRRSVTEVGEAQKRALAEMGLSDKKTLMILKAHDENGKLKLPESVRADQNLLEQAREHGDLVLIISHAVMPDEYKGTQLGAIFNYDQRVNLTTVSDLNQLGLETGYYTSSDGYDIDRNSAKAKNAVLVAA